MSEQKINAAIAEACGWTEIKDNVVGKAPGETCNRVMFLPNYSTSLNAMHEAEKMLDETQAEDYEELLRGYGFHATARERAEAFLRTLKAAEVRERNEILQQLNRIAQLQRWIPVEERLPKSYLTVLSLSRNKDIKLDFVQPKNIWYLGRNNVTHWMPLPEPPKEVQG